MAFTPRGLTACRGGDCHGIDHAWCAPGRHALPYSELVAALDRAHAQFEQRLGVTYQGRHREG